MTCRDWLMSRLRPKTRRVKRALSHLWKALNSSRVTKTAGEDEDEDEEAIDDYSLQRGYDEFIG